MRALHAWTLRPFSPEQATGAEVTARRGGAGLTLQFTIPDVGLALEVAPRLGAPGHALWRGTCFEAFIAQADGPLYLEWNLSSTGQHDVLGFEGIRQPIDLGAARARLTPTRFASALEGGALRLEFTLPLEAIRARLGPPPWRLQPTAILRRGDGDVFLAPAHTQARPDFHAFEHLEPVDL